MKSINWENSEEARKYYRDYQRKNRHRMPSANKEYRAKYYQENKHKYKERRQKYAQIYNKKNKSRRESQIKIYKQRNKDWYIAYKRSSKCLNCGESDFRCLQFHHIDKKSKTIDISVAVAHGHSINSIVKEVAKCIILCGNCHRIESCKITKKQKSTKQKWIMDHKKNLKCIKCDFSNSLCIDFHHKDPSTKIYSISYMIRAKGITIQNIEDEIAKCVPLCCNCHWKEHVDFETGKLIKK